MNSMGREAVAETFWIPFLNSWKNVQRRQDIFLAGTSGQRQVGDQYGTPDGVADQDG